MSHLKFLEAIVKATPNDEELGAKLRKILTKKPGHGELSKLQFSDAELIEEMGRRTNAHEEHHAREFRNELLAEPLKPQITSVNGVTPENLADSVVLNIIEIHEPKPGVRFPRSIARIYTRLELNQIAIENVEMLGGDMSAELQMLPGMIAREINNHNKNPRYKMEWFAVRLNWLLKRRLKLLDPPQSHYQGVNHAPIDSTRK